MQDHAFVAKLDKRFRQRQRLRKAGVSATSSTARDNGPGIRASAVDVQEDASGCRSRRQELTLHAVEVSGCPRGSDTATGFAYPSWLPDGERANWAENERLNECKKKKSSRRRANLSRSSWRCFLRHWQSPPCEEPRSATRRVGFLDWTESKTRKDTKHLRLGIHADARGRCVLRLDGLLPAVIGPLPQARSQ